MTTTLPEAPTAPAAPQVGGKRAHGLPFTAEHERKWPRAGVRRREDGAWGLMIWAEPDISVSWYANVAFAEHRDAIDLGATLAAAYRSGGVVEAIS